VIDNIGGKDGVLKGGCGVEFKGLMRLGWIRGEGVLKGGVCQCTCEIGYGEGVLTSFVGLHIDSPVQHVVPWQLADTHI
jgi:hypothetical protein